MRKNTLFAFRNHFGLIGFLLLNLIIGINGDESSSFAELQQQQGKEKTRQLLLVNDDVENQNQYQSPPILENNEDTCNSGIVITDENFDDYDDSWMNGKVSAIPGYGNILGRFYLYYKAVRKTFTIPLDADFAFMSFKLFEFDTWDDSEYDDKGRERASVRINGVTISLGEFLQNDQQQLKEDDYSTTAKGNTDMTLQRTSDGVPQRIASNNTKDEIHTVRIKVPRSIYKDTGGNIKVRIRFKFYKYHDQSAGIGDFKIIACKSPSVSDDPTTTSPETKTASQLTQKMTSEPTTRRNEIPTASPAKIPTTSPAKNPTTSPTQKPTPSPTKEPTANPTKEPTPSPTNEPTPNPTIEPTPNPTNEPTTSPTKEPTTNPTKEPTTNPTKEPTESPTRKPIPRPTSELTQKATSEPTQKVTLDPALKPTSKLTLTPTLKPTPYSTGKNVGEQCLADFQCTSGYCSQEKKTCYATRECNAIKQVEGSTFHENRIILVLVGSGFTDLGDWQDQAKKTFAGFSDFPFFEDSNDLFHVFFVNKLEPSFCNFGCAGIPRLLCCDTRLAKTLTGDCFPTGSTVQTIVIHNGQQYGGAGYGSANVAVASRHEMSGLVAVHELGHSLFELADEYNMRGDDDDPNCDLEGCSKWSDLSTLMGGNFCYAGGCNRGNYYTGAKDSFMKKLNKNVDHVNLRFTCCTYLVLTNELPSYCDQYRSIGVGLVSYCQKDYQRYGWPFSNDSNFSNNARSSSSSKSATPLLTDTTTTNQHNGNKGKYAKLENPVTLSVDIGSIVQNQRSSVRGANTPLQQQQYSLHTKQNMPGLYKRSTIIGEEEGDIFAGAATSSNFNGAKLLHVQTTYQSGKIQDRMYSGMQDVHVPFPDPSSLLNGDDDTIRVVKQPASTIDIFFDDGGEQNDGSIVKVDVEVISL